MKLITILYLVACMAFVHQATASKKVTSTVIITGVSVKELKDKTTEILAEVAKLLGVDADKVVSEGDVIKYTTTTSAVSAAPTTAAPTTTTAAPTTTTAAPTTTTAAPGRRRLSNTTQTTFKFSVTVADDKAAKAIADKLKSSKFKTDITAKMSDVLGKTVTINILPPVTTDVEKKKDNDLSKASTSFQTQNALSVLGILAFFAFSY
jgi:cell division septation protein DedD